MKRFFSVFIMLAMLVLFSGTAITGAAAENSVTASYDAADGSVSVYGQIGSEAGIPVTVCLTKDAQTAFSDANLPLAAYVIFTSENGAVSSKRVFEGVLPSGVVTLKLTSASGNAEAEILVFGENDEGTKAVLKAINTATSASDLAAELAADSNIEKLGFRLSDTEAYLSQIAAFCMAQRTAAGRDLTLQEATTAIHYTLFMCEMKNGGDLSEAVQKHYAGLDCSYADFTALSDAVRTELSALVSKNDYVALKEKATLSELVWVCKARIAADTWSVLKEMLTENADAYGIELGSGSAYEKVSKTNRQNVFYNMLAEVKSAVFVRDIKTAFDDSVAAELDKKTDTTKPSGSGSSSSSGSGSGSRGMVLSPSSSLEEQTDLIDDLKNRELTDIQGHFSEASVTYLIEKKVISGYPDQTFRPQNSVTRAEFAAIICKAFSVSEGGNAEAFTDVASDDWFADAVRALSSQGIIVGDGGSFRPNETISRQDAAVILNRVLTLQKGEEKAQAQDFADASSISDYAADSVNRLSDSGIIQGDNGLFRPRDAVKRGEAAVMVYRLLTMSV